MLTNERTAGPSPPPNYNLVSRLPSHSPDLSVPPPTPSKSLPRKKSLTFSTSVRNFRMLRTCSSTPSLRPTAVTLPPSPLPPKPTTPRGFGSIFGKRTNSSENVPRKKPPTPLTLASILRPHPNISSPVPLNLVGSARDEVGGFGRDRVTFVDSGRNGGAAVSAPPYSPRSFAGMSSSLPGAFDSPCLAVSIIMIVSTSVATAPISPPRPPRPAPLYDTDVFHSPPYATTRPLPAAILPRSPSIPLTPPESPLLNKGKQRARRYPRQHQLHRRSSHPSILSVSSSFQDDKIEQHKNQKSPKGFRRSSDSLANRLPYDWPSSEDGDGEVESEFDESDGFPWHSRLGREWKERRKKEREETVRKLEMLAKVVPGSMSSGGDGEHVGVDRRQPFYLSLDSQTTTTEDEEEDEDADPASSPSSRFSQSVDGRNSRASLRSQASSTLGRSPFQYFDQLSNAAKKRSDTDRINPLNRSTLLPARELAYPPQPRSPALLQPLRLMRPKSLPHQKVAVRPQSAFATSASFPRLKGVNFMKEEQSTSVVVPSWKDLSRRRGSSASGTELSKLIARKDSDTSTVKEIKRKDMGIQVGLDDPSSPPDPPRRHSRLLDFNRPPPLQLTCPPSTIGDFESAVSSPNETCSSGASTAVRSFEDVARAEVVSATVQSPRSHRSVRASLLPVPKRRDHSPTLPIPTSLGHLSPGYSPPAIHGILDEDKEERSVALEKEVARLTRIISILTGVTDGH